MIDTTRNRETMRGNGSATSIPIRYPFRKPADLVVLETTVATGATALKAIGVHYTVTGDQDSQGYYPAGGTVVMNTAPANTVTITVFRDPEAVQRVDPKQNGKIRVEQWIESPLDLLTMLAIRNREIAVRSMRQPDSDEAVIGTLPAKEARAAKFLGFDAGGNPVAMTPPTTAFVPVAQLTSYLKSELPAPGNIGTLAYVLDDAKGPWVDTGSAWAPIGGTVINALDYLKGDGSDEHTAFQTMLDTGLSIYFPAPPVAYGFDGALILRTSGQILFGDGQRSLIKARDNDFNMFVTGAPLANIGMIGLALEGGAVSDSTVQYALFTTPTNYIRNSVFNCLNIYETNNGLLFDTGSNDNTVHACEFSDLKGATSGHGYGVIMGAALRNVVKSCRFFGSAGNGRHAVYLGAGASYNMVSENFVSDFQQDCIVIYALSSQPACAYNRVTGNSIINGVSSATEGGAISIAGKSNHNMVEGNHINGFSKSGVVVSDSGQGGLCQDNDVKDNSIFNCGQFGVLVLGTLRTNVSDNTVTDCSASAASTYGGIDVRSSGSFGSQQDNDSTFTGNVVKGTAHRTAFRVDSTAPVPAGVRYKGNDFRAGAVAAVDYAGILLEGDDVAYVPIDASATVNLAAYGRITTVISLTVNISGAFTIAAPTLSEKGKEIELIVRNMTGGALGTITWNSVYKRSTWTSPGAGTSRTITFRFNGTNWIETVKGTADVAT